MSQLTAVDCQGFAGAFTLGVADAGFKIIGKHEMEGGFGVPSVTRNFSRLGGEFPVEVGPWRDWTPQPADFVFGNPPCSAFSLAGKRQGADDPISECMHAFVHYGAQTGAKVLAFESVDRAYTQGLAMMRRLHRKLEHLTGQEWDLHHVLHNGGTLGGAAYRPRYFWVASRVPLAFQYANMPLVTLFDAIGDLEGLEIQDEPQERLYVPSAWASRLAGDKVDGHITKPNSNWDYAENAIRLLAQLGREWEQGQRTSHIFPELFAQFGDDAADCGPKRFIERARAGKDMPFSGSHEAVRLQYDKHAPIVTGGTASIAIHPTEDRMLTLRELYRIQGFPDDWRLSGLREAHGNSVFSWPGKGIPVQAGRWLAKEIRAALDGHPGAFNPREIAGPREYVWGDPRPKKVYATDVAQEFADASR